MNNTEFGRQSDSQIAAKPIIRKDLRWDFHANRSAWIGFDPVTSGYFRLNEFEYFATQLMDGRRSVAEIVAGMNQRFATASIDEQWLNLLLQRLQTSFLLQPSTITSSWISSQYRTTSRGFLKQLLSNPLAIRVPLWLPRNSLSLFRFPAKVLFHELTVALVLVAAVIAIALVLRSLMENIHRIDLDPASITTDRWFILLFCYLAAKSLHEFGHLLACARYSVRSTEVGVLLLCLTPCFYCDTTDSWKLHSRWQRAMVSAAGMYIEIILAILAAIVWLVTLPGTLNLVAMNMMLVCSISTVLVNANPLFRFDGYYILSDLWGIPNLHEQSRGAIQKLFAKYLFRSPSESISVDGNPWLLAAFAVMSTIYRMMMLVAILWLCWTVLPPLGLGVVAVLISLSIAAGASVVYLQKIRQALRKSNRWAAGQLAWNAGVLCLLAASCVGILCLPVGRRIKSRAIADFDDKQPIYVSHDARVVHAADKSKLHSAGDELITMESLSARLEIAELRGKIRRLESLVAQLQLRQTNDSDASYQIPMRKEELAKLRGREVVLAREIEHLVFVAPQDGYLLDADSLQINQLTAVHDDRVTQTMFSSENEKCWTKRGELVAWFSSCAKPTAIALVPEHEINEINIGMHALVRSDCEASRVLEGAVIRISNEPVNHVPESLLGDEILPTVPGLDGEYKTEGPHYEVTIELTEFSGIPYATPCTVKFQLGNASIYRHIVEYLNRSLKPMML